MNDATRRNPHSPRFEKSAAPDRAHPLRLTRAAEPDRSRGREAGDAYPPRCSPRPPRAPLNDDQRGLTMRYLGMARAMASRFAQSRPLAGDEFESAAHLALVEAAQAYDSSRDVDFATYARHRIRGALMGVQRDLFAEGWRGDVDGLPKFQPFEHDSEEHGRVVGVRADRPVGAALETAETVENWLNKLPGLHSAAFRHIYFEGKSKSEAAALVGCSNASMSRIYHETLAWLHQADEPEAAAAPLTRRRRIQEAWSSRPEGRPRPVFGVAG